MPDAGTESAKSVAPADGAKEAAKPRAHPEGSVKDTIESILVAFILAFVFRAFVVEAFVIPTGSMAPTLLGAHTHFTCEDCGYKYTVNYSTGGDLSVPSLADKPIAPAYCPNCNHAVSADERQQPPVHYGDRILVLKYRYLLAEPQRWDVVVFKAPDVVPNAPRYTTNYIKRLIGRPGESIMMVDGDIYMSTETPTGSLEDSAVHRAFLKTFKIQEKPPHAQKALWRIVYDNDYIPHLPVAARSGSAWKQPWTHAPNGAGWNVGQDPTIGGRTRMFTFANDSGAGVIRFDPDANPNPTGSGQPFALTDFLAYDQEIANQARNDVSDLKLSCIYTRQSGDGALELTLSKRENVFTARLTPGKAELIWKRDNKDVVKAYPPVPVPALNGGPVQVELINVDYRVSVLVDGKEVLTTGEDYRPTGNAIVALVEQERQSSREKMVPTVQISAERQTCRIEHVSLWRDLFYVNEQNHGPRSSGGTFRGGPRDIVVLGKDEFFVMGDNPWISLDARAWTNSVALPGEDLWVPAGRVPRRFMLGKAFFVYWPAGYRPPGMTWGLIPNFGEMRFIH